jgi:hypothetical protein
VTLTVAAGFGTNVSSKYLFFTLPVVLVAASYFCVYLLEHLHPRSRILGAAVVVAVLLPSVQTDYEYFTQGHGYRDRLDEAVYFIEDRRNPEDQILFLHDFGHEESVFYLRETAGLAGCSIVDEQIIQPGSPEDLALDERIWVLTVGRPIPPGASGFLKWISEHTEVMAEFTAKRGPQDNTVRVYLHSPEPGAISGARRLLEGADDDLSRLRIGAPMPLGANG